MKSLPTVADLHVTVLGLPFTPNHAKVFYPVSISLFFCRYLCVCILLAPHWTINMISKFYTVLYPSTEFQFPRQPAVPTMPSSLLNPHPPPQVAPVVASTPAPPAAAAPATAAVRAPDASARSDITPRPPAPPSRSKQRGTTASLSASCVSPGPSPEPLCSIPAPSSPTTSPPDRHATANAHSALIR